MSRPVRKILSAENLSYRGIPAEFFDDEIEDFNGDDELKDLVYRYLKNIDLMIDDKMELIFYGSNGTGKTMLTSLIVKEAYKRRYSSFRITLQHFIDLHFEKAKDENIALKFDKIRNCELLVIDEVGKETFDKSQFNITKFEELLRLRDTLGYPTIICTNLPLDDNGGLVEQYGSSIASLVKGNKIQVEMVGQDYRKEKTRTKRGYSVLMGED